jgi:hypothetical protein
MSGQSTQNHSQMIVDAEYEYFGNSQIQFPVFNPDHHGQNFIPALPIDDSIAGTLYPMLTANLDSSS